MLTYGPYLSYNNDQWEVLAELYKFRNRDLSGGTGTRNATNLTVVQGMLQPQGLHVDVANTATQGIVLLAAAAASGQPYHLAIVDMMMPEVDGISMIRTLRTHKRLAGLRIIMLTSGAGPGERTLAREAGVDAYLTKPARRNELLNAIADTLSRAVASVPIAAPAADLMSITQPIIKQGGKPRLLLAEDNPVNQQIAKAMLGTLNVDIDTVINGEQAVAAAEHGAYDLILMDCQMPGMDGLEATRQIRSRFAQLELPIIALTANAMGGDRERCLECGMDDYLSKPFKKEQLQAMVRKWIKADV